MRITAKFTVWQSVDVTNEEMEEQILARLKEGMSFNEIWDEFNEDVSSCETVDGTEEFITVQEYTDKPTMEVFDDKGDVVWTNEILKDYYYCKTDSMGQRTGEVEKVSLRFDQLEYDVLKGFNYKGKYLYANLSEAIRAAMN